MCHMTWYACNQNRHASEAVTLSITVANSRSKLARSQQVRSRIGWPTSAYTVARFQTVVWSGLPHITQRTILPLQQSEWRLIFMWLMITVVDTLFNWNQLFSWAHYINGLCIFRPLRPPTHNLFPPTLPRIYFLRRPFFKVASTSHLG